MGPIVRSVLSVFAGLFVGVVLVGAIEGLSHLLYPFPPGLNPNDPAALAAFIKDLPTGAFVMVLLAWGVGTSAGAWVATRLARGSTLTQGLVVGVLFLLVAVANMAMIPHPLWMWVVGLVEFLPAAYVGAKLARRPPAKPVAEPQLV